MKTKGDKRYRVFFTIEVNASNKESAETYVADDPIGKAKGDVDMDFKVRQIIETRAGEKG